MSDLTSQQAIELIHLCKAMHDSLIVQLDEATELLSLHDRKRLSRRQMKILQRTSRDHIAAVRETIGMVGLFLVKYSDARIDELKDLLLPDGTFRCDRVDDRAEAAEV